FNMWGILILINTNVGKILELIPILSLLDLFNKNVIRCRVIMFCERLKNPYKGLSNLVGGKIEDGEKGIDAAYRELLEETNIS
ncbi:NUDIX hydrolase, partial [Micrococcus sp. SIMBA_144]